MPGDSPSSGHITRSAFTSYCFTFALDSLDVVDQTSEISNNVPSSLTTRDHRREHQTLQSQELVQIEGS